MNAKDKERYILIGRIIRQISNSASSENGLSSLEKNMLSELKLCDSHFRRSRQLVEVLAGQEFLQLTEIMKAMDMSQLHLTYMIASLKSGGLQIEGTAEKGYRFFV